MASKGSRAAGTDGSDYSHRERVAPRLAESLKAKKNLKTAIFIHIALWVVMAFKMVDDVLDRFDILVPSIAELAVPKPLLWEYVWMLSILPSIFGLSALTRNRLIPLKIFLYGTIAFGLLPLIGGAVSNTPEFLKYLQTHHTHNRLFDWPVVVLWGFFMVPALQVHLVCLYYGQKLKSVWDKPKVR